MKFILNLAYREMRASWHRLLFFFLCIAIGVGSIVTLRSLVQNLKASVNTDARSLLTADVQASTNNAWNDMAKAALQRAYTSPAVAGQTARSSGLVRAFSCLIVSRAGAPVRA